MGNNYLVDTHIFLWWLNSDKKLKKSIQKTLENPNNHVYVSIVTLWEISIKHKNGKLPLKTTLAEMVSLSGFTLLPIILTHVLQLEKLPTLHNDPFDRMLIATAQAEDLTLITDDEKIKKYDVKVL